MKRPFLLLLVWLIVGAAYAQNTLPGFTVIEKNNRVFVSWVNPYETCVQLNVQRSFDSIKNYRTVYSAASPELPQNGFNEPKQPYTKTYYRIFYVLNGGAYFFTPAQLTVPDASKRMINETTPNVNEVKTVTVSNRNGTAALLATPQFLKFKDSIFRETKDTLVAFNDSFFVFKPFVPKEVWKPSNFIYTNKEGYLTINLPEAAINKYHLKIYEEDGSLLFEIKRFKEQQLTLNKANFVHAGWYTFELLENEKILEKNKFYLSKDF